MIRSWIAGHPSNKGHSRIVGAGYPIASALIEWVCPHAVGDRVKGLERRWDGDGAEAMARLRALRRAA